MPSMLLDEAILAALARGCAVLGAGGGGSTGVGLLAARQAVRDHGPVRLITLDELPGEGVIMPVGLLGAPTVTLEKIGHGDEGKWLREAVERELDQPVVAVMSVEIGGSNGLLPVAWAAGMDLPLLDADAMGRAFPEVQHVSMHLAGIPATPSVLVDQRRQTAVFREIDAFSLERLSRAVAVSCGGIVSQADHLLTVGQARTAVIPGSVSLAVRIGRLLDMASDDPVAALVAGLEGYRILDGKITDVERRLVGGFVRGSCLVEGLGVDGDRLVRLEIQNELLVALEDGEVLASVPDIISLLDSQTGDAIPTELLRYGQRVTLIALPCAPLWRGAAGLALTGPAAFGYSFPYRTLEEAAADGVIRTGPRVVRRG